MDLEKVFIVMVSLVDDKPNQVLSCFKTKEKAEKFITIQKGINFPYKSYEIVESEIN